MSEIKKYTINIWLKNNGAPFIYRNCIAYEKGSFYCVFDGEAVYKYPLSDIWRVSESYPQDMQGKNNHNALRQKSVDSEERAHLEKLVPDLKKRIAELEAENDRLQFWLVSAGEEIDQLTADSTDERKKEDECTN
jgi:hypothetical protein